MRNTRAVATREERVLAREESLASNEAEVLEKINELTLLQESEENSLYDLNESLPGIDSLYEEARHRYLTLEQARESAFRQLENAKLLAINARLPSTTVALLTSVVKAVVGSDIAGLGPDGIVSTETRTI